MTDRQDCTCKRKPPYRDHQVVTQTQISLFGEMERRLHFCKRCGGYLFTEGVDEPPVPFDEHDW